MNHLRRKQSGSSDAGEILEDMEMRIAELLTEHQGSKSFIQVQMVEQVIDTMGMPEDFDRPEASFSDSRRKEGFAGFTLDKENKMIAGVCAGLGNRFHLDPLWIRIAFLISFLIGGAGFLIYCILWVVVPATKNNQITQTSASS
jgi:phage shock protein PspC (stress-responsive transcriptional regulator)